VYIFFLLFLLHRQPAATGLYIQTPQKNRSASIYFLPLYILYVHDKENLNGLFSSRSGYSIFHLTLEIKGNYYPMAVGCGHIYRRFYWSTNVYASIVYNNWNMDSYAHRSYWSPRWVGSFTPPRPQRQRNPAARGGQVFWVFLVIFMKEVMMCDALAPFSPSSTHIGPLWNS
jgi:hypothetical protein